MCPQKFMGQDRQVPYDGKRVEGGGVKGKRIKGKNERMTVAEVLCGILKFDVSGAQPGDPDLVAPLEAMLLQGSRRA